MLKEVCDNTEAALVLKNAIQNFFFQPAANIYKTKHTLYLSWKRHFGCRPQFYYYFGMKLNLSDVFTYPGVNWFACRKVTSGAKI